MTNLALFDLDHTLIRLDSDHEWGRFMVRHGIVDAEHFERENNRFFADYQAGKLDIQAYLQLVLAPLALHSRAQLAQWHKQFMREIIEPAIIPAARELVRAHQDSGDLCCVVTATNEFVTRPIVTALEIDMLIACEVQTIGGDPDAPYTGRAIGTPSYREGKVTRIDAWLASLGKHWSDFERSYFYSDSHNDIALLEKVTDPIATNPDATLRAHALSKGWRILDFLEPS